MRAQINCEIDPFTISGSVLCTLLSPESRAATSRVSGGKDLTAVHGCNPTLSVSVALVSRKVNFLRSISLAVFVF